jgi:nucleoside-diphosphate-sugar epimerase
MILAIRSGRFGVIGKGDNLLNVVYVTDVATGAIRAANEPAAVGQAYNLSSAGEMTQRQFVDAIAEGLGLPRVGGGYPFRLAFALGLFSEVVGHLIRIRRPPHVTRYGVSLMGRSTSFSTEKARVQLGWQPLVSTAEGLRRTLEWFRANGPSPPRS